MEYTFQNGPNDKPVTITLGEFELEVLAGGRKRSINYAEITEVRLGRKKNLYFIEIVSLDLGELLVTNRYYDHSGHTQDQARAYQTFVRILHLHLKNKSRATFYSGFSLSKQLIKVGISMVVGALLFAIEDYFDFVSISAVMTAFAGFAVTAIILITPKITQQWPRSYAPSDIPLNLLPPS